ncbi:MAG: phosphate ABC transporter ATP-binding protein [Firmicutes bacterium]|nr:phosphate ABC transporter ATP-binding protein [Bacillota bacterium]
MAPQPLPEEVRELNTVSSTSNQVLGADGLNLWYGTHHVLKGITLGITRHRVTALIGPSGCGKSSFLRCFNRMNELIPESRVEGRIHFNGRDINDPEVDATEVRHRIGMVFQKPNPFPKSIFDNVAFGPRVNGYRGDLGELVETSLRRAALWDEVHDRLGQSALALSGGQQQRLCIARALAVEPEVLLMDEPCSALDPASTAKIEDLIGELKERYSIIIVTHNMQQAARVSDQTAFLLEGEIVEYGRTGGIFTRPEDPRTEDYITGRFG